MSNVIGYRVNSVRHTTKEVYATVLFSDAPPLEVIGRKMPFDPARKKGTNCLSYNHDKQGFIVPAEDDDLWGAICGEIDEAP